MPSGLLVVHPATSKVVAVASQSPLTAVALKIFNEGAEVGENGMFMELKILKSRAGDVDSFESVGTKYLSQARLQMRRIDIRAPLGQFIPVTSDLTAAYDQDQPFERIIIGAIP